MALLLRALRRTTAAAAPLRSSGALSRLHTRATAERPRPWFAAAPALSPRRPASAVVKAAGTTLALGATAVAATAGGSSQQPTAAIASSAPVAAAALPAAEEQALRALVPAVAVGSVPAIRGVVFDMDGTLTRPHAIDFARLRARLGVAPGQDLLQLLTTGDAASRARAAAIVDDEERLGAERCRLQPGYHELMAYLARRGLPTALLTRNSQANVDRFLASHGLANVFDPLLTRDAPHGYKPSPHPLLHIAGPGAWALPGGDARHVLMVGDSADDLVCGQRAGALTCLMLDDRNGALVAAHRPTFVITRLDELIAILDAHAPPLPPLPPSPPTASSSKP